MSKDSTLSLGEYPLKDPITNPGLALTFHFLPFKASSLSFSFEVLSPPVLAAGSVFYVQSDATVNPSRPEPPSVASEST